MIGLAELQAQFQGGILTPNDDTTLALINNGTWEPAATLFGVYRYAYAARLVEVLQANFDKTWSLLGDDGFDDAARAYIAEFPSTARNARWYGSEFGEFLTSYCAEIPAVADLAALDWAIASAFDAPDQDSVAVEAMAVFHPQEWPSLRFQLHPAVRFVPVSTEAARIYEALSSNDAPGDLEPSTDHTVLVWRDDHTVRFRALEADEANLLAGVVEGLNFASLCERAAEAVGADQAGMRGAGLLRLWLDSGMIAAVKID
mgnify:CR=1 FL=1